MSKERSEEAVGEGDMVAMVLLDSIPSGSSLPTHVSLQTCGRENMTLL